ncbi:hypothetical protein IEQ44_12795 [Nocardioides sp. Y6]|uniref:DUF4440 domain-containing protein n=1 Tax=Nocardioides malaquae TaxID=2773426 RepID=A0ABR9RVE3_9ACTN|nr:hypothetical protein [Nocardioides malaquae]MBE7325529.1 hypothetical protein [Nocardioides malaquae]
MNSSRTFTALLVLGALLLTGCSQEEPEPKFADEPSASPTPEAKETAKEFIRRWNDELTAMQKGDTREYREIAGACEPCMSAADKVDEYYAAGGYVATEGRTLVEIEKQQNHGRNRATYRIVVDSAPTEYQTKANGPIESFTGGRVTYGVLIQNSKESWQILDTWQIPS